MIATTTHSSRKQIEECLLMVTASLHKFSDLRAGKSLSCGPKFWQRGEGARPPRAQNQNLHVISIQSVELPPSIPHILDHATTTRRRFRHQSHYCDWNIHSHGTTCELHESIKAEPGLMCLAQQFVFRSRDRFERSELFSFLPFPTTPSTHDCANSAHTLYMNWSVHRPQNILQQSSGCVQPADLVSLSLPAAQAIFRVSN